ncbi:MAG TPA: agmatine deiminase family protein [Gemmatimonadales bacterium]
MTDPRSPAARGFRMPAEWERHRGTWLSWPHKEASWPGNFAPVPGIIAEMIRHLAAVEEVHINVSGDAMEQQARFVLTDAHVAAHNVVFHHNPTDDAWCRDHGPIFVQREYRGATEQLILDWGYNSWGGKYPPFDQDDVIPSRIGAALDIPVEHPGMILEGGSIDVNGRGTLLTTEACLLNPNRNPELSRHDIEQRLRNYLGVTNVLWLGDGIVGDDTDGHIDDLTRFVDPHTVVTVLENDIADENHAPLAENLRRLQEMRDQDGEPLRVVELPMPPALYYEEQRLPASYANFYIANGLVLMPGYDAATDRLAADVLQRCFPHRQVITIDCRALVWGLGAFHCLTQQWPG